MTCTDDLSQPVIVHGARLAWVPSPAPGVERRMLYRVGDEVARATSIVRYAPDSRFPRHTHGGGEEILVLDGTFQDEHGDYPTGCYLRNPPGSSHAPAASAGCTIFVRLWQFRADDGAQVVRQPGTGQPGTGQPGTGQPGTGQPVAPRPGASGATVLFDDGHEAVRLEDWRAGASVTVVNTRGLEFLLVSGSLTVGGDTLEPQGWGRLPAGVDLVAVVGAQGARVWYKDAPLQHPDVLRMP